MQVAPRSSHRKAKKVENVSNVSPDWTKVFEKKVARRGGQISGLKGIYEEGLWFFQVQTGRKSLKKKKPACQLEATSHQAALL